MTTTTLTLTRDEVKALKAEYGAVVRKLKADGELTAADRSTLDAYARATAQSWANYSNETYYLSRVGIYLIPMTRFDLAFRARNGQTRLGRLVEKYEPVKGGWYATSLGTV
jgi:hypothetical protein